MSDKPARAARPVKLNVINEPKDSYTGGPSSLCPGCGHDQISNVIINAAWENGIQPTELQRCLALDVHQRPHYLVSLMDSTLFTVECHR